MADVPLPFVYDHSVAAAPDAASPRQKMWTAPDPLHEQLQVVTVVANPLRWWNRWKNYERFAKHVTESGGHLYTVEVAYGRRDHAVEEQAQHAHEVECCIHPDGHHHWIRVRTESELWSKECAINLAARFFPPRWTKVAWIDADVTFLRPNWIGETLHQLEHFEFVQMFSSAHDMGPDYRIITTRPSFAHAYIAGDFPVLNPNQKRKRCIPYYYYYGGAGGGFGAWSGLAWAARREAFDYVSGLINTAITGAADWYQAWALINRLDEVIPAGTHPNLAADWLRWQTRAQQLGNRSERGLIGVVDGSIAHHWHGRKKDRKYVHRSNILSKYKFDPLNDMRFDWQGLPHLIDDGSPRMARMMDEIRAWVRQRNEDTTEV
jgi:hypothetical protein